MLRPNLRSSHRRGGPVAAALFVVAFAALLGAFGGCGLPTAGLSGEAACPGCTDASQCTLASPCVEATCQADGCCAFTPLPDGDAATQVPGDCHRAQCAAGALADVVDVGDVEDDGEPCTDDSCDADGTVVHAPIADDTECHIGAAKGSCKSGTCTIVCSSSKACPDDGNPCTDDLCNLGLGTCSYPILHGVPTPGVTQLAGDCRTHTCVNGSDENVVADDDLPVDGIECTFDVCNGGTPSNPPLSTDSPCGAGGTSVCDGSGSCNECNVPSQCFVGDPADTFCSVRTCIGGSCGKNFPQNGTALPIQNAGDCKKSVCDGAGNIVDVNDNLDLPVDNNACTNDVCTNGSPTNPPIGANTPCGVNAICDGAGQCVGCITASDCPGTDDFCKTRTCSGGVCGYQFTPNDTAFPPAMQLSGDCKERRCDGGGNEKQVPLGSDLPNDGNDCTGDICTMGSPSNPPLSTNTPCASGFCDTGVCYQCNLPMHCPQPPVCTDATCNGHTCGQQPTPNGTAIATQTPQDCQKVVCDGGGGTTTVPDTGDVPNDGNPCTIDSCNGATPTFTNAGAGTPCGAGHVCDGNGFCGKATGQACAAPAECATGFCVDGFCCNALCNGTCQGCSLALTNLANGTCGSIKPGTEDTSPACNGPNSCDGAGNCKFDNGQVCSAASQCTSGFCADGFCCNVVCNGTCRACSAALTGGTNGTCANILKFSEDDAPVCNGASSCDGAGNCKKDNGQTCALPGECSSGFCADGVCCDVACNGTCKACTAALNGGTTGVCGNVVSGLDDTGCSGTSSCNGSGACALDNGQVCGMPSQCVSGSCIDGVCCNVACTATCQACTAALTGGTTGVCSNTSAGLEDANGVPACTGTSSCNGSGACAFDDGQGCSAPADCASGFCVDGFCCQNACAGTCKACSNAKTGAINGACADITQYTDDDAPVCGGTQTCNGAGACLLDNGQPCGMASACASNNCPAGTCAP